MLTRRDIGKKSVIEKFVDNFISTYFGNLSINQFTYLDEIYRVLASRLSELGRLGSIDINYPDDYTIVKSVLYKKLFNDARLIASVAYNIIPETYEQCNSVINNIVEQAESISLQLNTCKTMVDTIEGTLKRKLSITSIKDEILQYDTISVNTFLQPGDLTIDKRAGYLTLGIANGIEIPFKIKNIEYNRTKGIRLSPKIGGFTWDFITNGYFTSRTFSSSPLFENEYTKDHNRMLDGDLETSYMVEYNSDDNRESMKINLDIEVEKGRVDLINIVADPGDNTSVITSSVVLPKINRLLIEKDDKIQIDKTEDALNNIINLNNISVGEIEGGIRHTAPDIYPTGSFIISENNINKINIEFVCDKPQEVSYPEKIVKDITGNTLHRFNYFETLVLDKYTPPVTHIDPKEYYTISEISELHDIMESGYNSYNENQSLYRYFIGIKELQLLRFNYHSKGNVKTHNLNSSGKRIAAVDLFVNEIIYEGTEIHYYFSTNTVDWNEISPQGRVNNLDLPKRIVFEGFETISTDLLLSEKPVKIYLMIEMNGTGGITPILKAYAVRIKFISE